ncbi:hypothetical protein [uncultured Muribaculum sp.]|uniref:hypothetical protein n=1 Tax=uncultured Muribaculum sp. TaxID=1918613 RepID=UPI00265B3510|nr:hypothetical protein [uncultured Muribaculum sp.]
MRQLKVLGVQPHAESEMPRPQVGIWAVHHAVVALRTSVTSHPGYQDENDNET